MRLRRAWQLEYIAQIGYTANQSYFSTPIIDDFDILQHPYCLASINLSMSEGTNQRSATLLRAHLKGE